MSNATQLEYIAEKEVNKKGNLEEALATMPYRNQQKRSEIIMCMRSVHHVSDLKVFLDKIKSWMNNNTTIIFEVPDRKGTP